MKLILLSLVLAISAFADPLVLANYYAWYHTDEGHQGWTRPGGKKNPKALAVQRPGEPVLASAAYPLIGPYDSANSAVAAWHVKLAEAAGIDAFLVDWWGTHKGRDANIDAGILPAVEGLGFKFALLDERAQFHNDWPRYKASALAALKRYKDSPAYLKIDGKPVYYLYQVAAAPTLTPAKFADLRQDVEAALGPVYWIVNTIAHAHREPPAQQKRIPQDWLATEGVDAFAFYSTFSNFRAHRYDELIGKYRYLSGLAHGAGKKMLLPVHPGHDNSHFRDDSYIMPRRNGQTLRDFLRAATDAKADFVMITSWNEWPETTVIEPSSSWPDPYLYLRILAEWRGQSFTPPALPVLFGGSPQARESDANEAPNN
ncbi:MAG: glycoprotein endo-alpha-1,2-mannosidase [Rhodothermales bacterium]